MVNNRNLQQFNFLFEQIQCIYILFPEFLSCFVQLCIIYKAWSELFFNPSIISITILKMENNNKEVRIMNFVHAHNKE